jgi:hypothetical protein
MPLNKKDFSIKRNDTLPALQICVIDRDCLGGKQPFQLSGVTAVTFTMIDDCGQPKIFNKEAQIYSYEKGIIQYNWNAEDTNQNGLFKGEFQLEFSGGGKLSLPQDSPIQIEIYKDLNPY